MLDFILGIVIGLPMGGLLMHGLHEYIDSLMAEDDDEKSWLGGKK